MGVREKRFCDYKVKRGRKTEACGKDIAEDMDTSITYGTSRYLMDLCEEHKQLLESQLQPFLTVAHNVEKRVGTQIMRAIKGKDGQAFTAADVRAWLKEQGKEISPMGRIPTHLMKEFQAAHQ